MTKQVYNLTPRLCKWHGCKKEFQPSVPVNEFCCRKCVNAWSSWKYRKGIKIMPALIAQDMPAIAKFMREIEKEIAGET